MNITSLRHKNVTYLSNDYKCVYKWFLQVVQPPVSKNMNGGMYANHV